MMAIKRNLTLLIFVLLCIVFVLSCKKQTLVNKETFTKNKPLKIIRDKNISINQKENVFEISINQIELLNSKSLLNQIPNPIFLEDGNNYPNLVLLNNDETQKLTMLFYPGSSKNSVSYFILETVNETVKKNKNIFHSNAQIFKTNNDMTIGVSEENLVEKYNSNNLILDKKMRNNVTILTYVENNYKKSSLLKKYNMPLYMVKYMIKNKKIVKIEFGFTNP